MEVIISKHSKKFFIALFLCFVSVSQAYADVVINSFDTSEKIYPQQVVVSTIGSGKKTITKLIVAQRYEKHLNVSPNDPSQNFPFVSGYDLGGKMLWRTQLLHSEMQSDASPILVAVDSKGFSYTTHSVGNNSNDVSVLDPSGKLTGTFTLKSDFLGIDYYWHVNGIFINSSDDLLIVGTQTGLNRTEAFVAKYSVVNTTSNGSKASLVWKSLFNGRYGASLYAERAALTSDGTLYVAGDIYNPNGSYDTSPWNNLDIQLYGVRSDGSISFDSVVNRPGRQEVRALGVDSHGNISVVAQESCYESPLDHGKNCHGVQPDTFIASFTSAGIVRWSNALMELTTAPQRGFGRDIVFDGSDNIALLGGDSENRTWVQKLDGASGQYMWRGAEDIGTIPESSLGVYLGKFIVLATPILNGAAFEFSVLRDRPAGTPIPYKFQVPLISSAFSTTADHWGINQLIMLNKYSLYGFGYESPKDGGHEASGVVMNATVHQ